MINVLVMCLCRMLMAEQAWEVNEHHHEAGIRFGDMMLTPAQLSRYSTNLTEGTPIPIRGGAVVVENSYNRWPANIVPYQLSAQYSTANQRFLRTALATLSSQSCFKFVERTTQDDYILIAPLDGCYSFVGRIGGRQVVSLSSDCLADYIVFHELLHVLGFEHEHQRPDRDTYIKVEYKHVQAGQMVNFEKLRPGSVEVTEPYDFQSIMHYDGNAFGRFDSRTGRRLATMIPLRRGVVLLDNFEFSELDLKKLRSLGNCPKYAPTHSASTNFCKDFSPVCQKIAEKGSCDPASQHYHFVKDQCKRSCGLCPGQNGQPRTSTAPPPPNLQCVDELTGCRQLARRNWCNNITWSDYSKRCSKSCKRC